MNGIAAERTGTFITLDEYRAGGPPITADNLVKGFYSALFTLREKGRHQEEAAKHAVWVSGVERHPPSALYTVKLDFVDGSGQTLSEAEALFANGLLVDAPNYGLAFGKQPVNGGYLREGETYGIPRFDEPITVAANSPLVPAFA